MKTLVKSVCYAGVLGQEEERGFQVVQVPPREFLKATLDNYWLGSYCGFIPWLIPCSEEHSFLHIEKFDANVFGYVEGSVKDFLNNTNFDFAKRSSKLSGRQRLKLAEGLLFELNPNSDGRDSFIYRGIARFEHYQDILGQLGFELSREDFNGIVDRQIKNHDQRIMRERYKFIPVLDEDDDLLKPIGDLVAV